MRSDPIAPERDRGVAGPRARHGSRHGSEFVSALERVSREIRDPVAKLRFIRGSLARYETQDRMVRTVPWAPIRRVLYRWLSLEGLRHLFTANPLGSLAVSGSARASLALSRAMALTLPLLAAGAAVAGVYRLSRSSALTVAAPTAAAVAPMPLPVAPAEEERPQGPVVPMASIVPAGLAPAAIWMVEKGDRWEQYSNGLRIDTTYATDFARREYRVFDESGNLDPAVRATPVGLLFHTSESDVWPLEAEYNENLRDSSHRLLRYVQRNHLYHYVIDRFGRVYRIVNESAKANHAGFSVWADDGHVYLNLNHAFIGISFETRWDGGKALPITQAQFAAGRNLSDYLRQRYAISPSMCVTHGLTSVNPKKHLIGHHMDWARGFPFEAFGLPDQYVRPAPSVALFGFGYDGDFLKVLDRPWDGVRKAEDTLSKEASRRGLAVEALRRERQSAFDRWIEEQQKDEDARAALPVERRRARAPEAGAIRGAAFTAGKTGLE
jgi:hypothetical protein